MAVKISQGFKRTSDEPIDTSIVLTQSEMLAMEDFEMPDVYFAMCKDDGCLYTYDKSATPNSTTGKFTKMVGGGGNTESRELTQAEYDALSDDEKNNGTVYFITDGQGGGGGTNDYIWDVSNPASYNEIKAVVEAGERPVIVKRNGHYYYPFQYGVNEYPEEPELPCEFSVYFTSGNNYRYILNYQCDSDKRDQPMTAVVDRSEEVAAKLSTSVYSNINSASSYTRFMNNELKVATGINNSTKEKLEFTFKTSSDQLVKKVPLFPEYQVHDNGANGNFQLVGTVKTNNTTYNLYSFYMQTGALPNSTTKTYSLSSILSGYTVQAFTDVSGVTSSGASVGGVKDDGTINLAVVTVDSSGVTLRANSNMSSQTAMLKITFMGSKN